MLQESGGAYRRARANGPGGSKSAARRRRLHAKHDLARNLRPHEVYLEERDCVLGLHGSILHLTGELSSDCKRLVLPDWRWLRRA